MSEIDPRTYASWRATALGHATEQAEMRAVFSLAPDLRGLDVLDLGAGDGAYSIEAARRGARVTALDTSSAMLTAASRRAHETGVEIAVHQGTVEALPFPDGSFDCIFAITVFCFLSQPTRALAEIFRVLKPGGCLVWGDLNRNSLWALERILRGALGHSIWGGVSFRTETELRMLCQQAGFGVGASQHAVYFPRVGWLARLMLPWDSPLGKLRVPGAAFIAVAARRA